MQYSQQRCCNCNAPANSALCAPCAQDRLLEQAQLAASKDCGRGLRCTD